MKWRSPVNRSEAVNGGQKDSVLACPTGQGARKPKPLRVKRVYLDSLVIAAELAA